MSSILIPITHQSPMATEGGERLYVSMVKPDEISRYGEKLVELIRDGVEAAKKLLEAPPPYEVCKNPHGVDYAACILEKLADATSISIRRYFVVPLIPPLLGKELRDVVPTPHDVFYAWVLGKELEYIRDVLARSVVDLRKAKVNIEYDDLKNAVKNTMIYLKHAIFPPSSEKEAIGRIELLMKLPADTRPGCSMSKLIPHLLATTGIAVAIYVNELSKNELDKQVKESVHRLELALLRLASLLHDVGKPRSWIYVFKDRVFRSHAEESAGLLKEIGVEDFLKRLGLEEVYKALYMLIQKHHNVDELPQKFEVKELGIALNLKALGRILHDADASSSNIDRLGDLFADLTKDVLEKYAKKYGVTVRELFAGVGTNIWNAWFEILGREGDVKKIVDAITSRVRAYAVPPQLLEVDKSKPVKGVKLAIFDIANVQGFIRREDLRILSSASFVIDLCTVYAIPRAVIERLGLAVDSIIYAGGGIVIALVPQHVSDDDIERVVSYVKNLIGFDININYALADLEESWPLSIRKALAKLATRKDIPRRNIQRDSTASIETGYEVLCEYCGRRPATYKEGSEYICSECKVLHDLGSSMYIRSKLEALSCFGYQDARKIIERSSKAKGGEAKVATKDENLLQRVYQYLLQWFSGVKLERLGREEYRVALVKMDGNAVGLYMSSAINIAEAVCRSIRIDMGMKMGFLAALQKLREILNEEEFDEDVTRVFTGVLYAGGDDMLALWPAHIAIPVALVMAKTFWVMNGGEVTLSIAVAVAKPRHNVWNVLDSANRMLKMCKSGYRQDLGKEVLAGKLNLLAMISFIKSDWQLFEAEVEQLFRRYGGNGYRLTYQPFLVPLKRLQNGGCRDFLTVLNVVVGNAINMQVNSVDDAVKALVELTKAEKAPILKGIVSMVHDSMGVLRGHGGNKAVLALYLARESQRVEEPGKGIYRGAANLAMICSDLPPLFDIYNLVEIVSTG